MSTLKFVRTPTLDIGYLEAGPADGQAVVLLHGYPYDVHAFNEVVPLLTAAGLRTIVPYLRGYGPTQFVAAATARSGEQASIGQDLLDLLDALRLEKATVAGFDWGARAACIVAALWPGRVQGLVSCGGYQIQDISRAGEPMAIEQEHRLWYQYYFQTERGRLGLEKMRAELSRLLWKMWSPTWAFDDACFARTAASFENRDFVEVVIHSYRHRMGLAAGAPQYAALQARLAQLPVITVPSIVLHGADDDVFPPASSQQHQRFFSGPYERRVLPGIGHNPPQEAAGLFAKAVLDVARR